MARSNEPFWWSLFSAGGVVSAFLIPIHILLFGILYPMGVIVVSYDSLQGVITHPLGRLYLFVLISLSLFHAGHRLRFVLVEVGLKPVAKAVTVACYAVAIVGTFWAGAIVVML